MRSWRSFASGLPLTTVVLALISGCATTTPGERDAGGPTALVRGSDGAIEETLTIPTSDLGPEAGAPAAITVDAETAAETERAKQEAEAFFSSYRIGAGDILGFRLFDDETLNTTVTVRHDGFISLPWIPDLKVAGLTRAEATDQLTQAYNELYVDTEASLVVIDSRSKFYTVMGDVERPSEYPYERPLTLLDGINNAGGLRVNQRGGDTYAGAQGQLVKALVIRHDGSDRKVLEYDLRGFQEPGAHVADTPILPGDLVYVPEGVNLVYLLGEVGRSQVFALSQNMTLLQLLANAGGFSEQTARLREVVVMRERENDSTEVYHVNVRRMLKDGSIFRLRAGDIIYVPQKRLTSLSAFLSRLYSPATQTMSVASQVLGLYQAVWNAWYTDERFELLYEQGDTEILNTLEMLRSLQDISVLNGVSLTD